MTSKILNALIPTNSSRVPSNAIRILYKIRWFTLGFYLLVICGCAYPASLLPGAVSQDTKAPAGSPSAEALELYQRYFPDSSSVTGIIVYLRQIADLSSIANTIGDDYSTSQTAHKNGQFVNDGWNNNLTLTRRIFADMITDDRTNMLDFNLEYYCREEMSKGVLDAAYLARNPTPAQFYNETLYLLSRQGAEVDVYSAKHNFSFFNSYSSYRAVVTANLPVPVGEQYVSNALRTVTYKSQPLGATQQFSVKLNHSSYTIISVKPPFNNDKVIEFATKLQNDILPELLNIHGLADIVDCTVISAPNFFIEIGNSVGSDLTRMFSVVIPIAFVVFSISLSSGRLALLPLAVFGSSLVSSMAILYGVAAAGQMGVNSLAPGIVMMFTIALTLDFTFFIASQWKRVIIEQIRELLVDTMAAGGSGSAGSSNGSDIAVVGESTETFAGDSSNGSSSALVNTTSQFNDLLSKKRMGNNAGPKDELGVSLSAQSKKQAGRARSDSQYLDFSGTNGGGANTSAVTLAPNDELDMNRPLTENFFTMRTGPTTSDEKTEGRMLYKLWTARTKAGSAQVSLANEIDRVEVLKRVYSAAGKTLIVATSAIILSALGICAFSVDLISSIGVTVVVCTFVTGITSAILPATMLLTFHSFFFATLERWCNVIKPENCTTPAHQLRKGDDPQNNISEGLLSAAGSVLPPTPSNNATAPEQGQSDSTAARNGKPSSSAIPQRSTRVNNGTILTQVALDNAEAELALLKQVAETSSSNTTRRAASYRQFVRFVITPPKSFIFALVSVGVLLAFAIAGSDSGSAYVYSSNVNQFIPADSFIVGGWNQFQVDFNPGALFSYNLLQLYPSLVNFTTDDFFSQQHFIVKTLVQRLPQTTSKDFEGMAYSGVLSDNILQSVGGNITFTDLATCGYYNSLGIPLDPLCSYELLLSGLFTSTLNAPGVTYLSIALGFDPTKQDPGENWYFTFVNDVLPYLERTVPFVTKQTQSASEAEAAADRFLGVGGLADSLPSYMRIRMYLRGSPGETFDTVTYATSALKTIIAVAVPILFFVVFAAFGSLVIALRIMLTVALTVACVFSITAGVYTKSALDFLKTSSVEGRGSLMWQMPFIVILLSAAVSLNYELIGTAKIVDFRWKNIDGLGSTRSAIETGFSIVGREVSVAGAMMMIVFFGFLLSQVSALNQIGFALFLTALLSAFWVRLFMTPPIMSILGEANWFPLTLLPERFRPPMPKNGPLLNHEDKLPTTVTKRSGNSNQDETPQQTVEVRPKATATGHNNNRAGGSADQFGDDQSMAEMRETSPTAASRVPQPPIAEGEEHKRQYHRASSHSEADEADVAGANNNNSNNDDSKADAMMVDAYGVSVTVDQTFEDM